MLGIGRPKTLRTKVIHQKATCGRRCQKPLVISSKEDKDFPDIGLPNTQDGRSHIDFKTKTAWKYVYENYRDDYDFLIETDTDTYLVVENLLHFLSDKDPSKRYMDVCALQRALILLIWQEDLVMY